MEHSKLAPLCTVQRDTSYCLGHWELCVKGGSGSFSRDIP